MPESIPDSIRPLESVNLTEKDILRIESGINRLGPDDCWVWRRSKLYPGGYGKTKIRGVTKLAHRLTFQIHIGDPGTHFVLHRCDNPPCCNPRHLFLGTHKDNMRDCFEKGRRAKGDSNGARLYPDRLARGESHPGRKLTEKDVIEIRKLRALGWAAISLSAKFGVTYGNICHICSRRNWRHVP